MHSLAMNAAMQVVTAFSTADDGSCRFFGETPDDKIETRANRIAFLTKHGLDETKLVTNYPIKEPRLRVITPSRPVKRARAEALITQIPNKPLGIISNDCMPLLLADEANTTIGAVHLQRNYLKEQFLENVVDAMSEKGTGQIRAFLGPCLQRDSHTLDQESVAALTLACQDVSLFISPSSNRGEFCFNFSEYVAQRLQGSGVNIAFQSTANTYTNMNYYSRRRRMHQTPDRKPEMNLSVIALRK